MEELIKSFEKMASRLSELAEDGKTIIARLEDGKTVKDLGPEERAYKSFHPKSKVYPSAEKAREAAKFREDQPDLAFVIEKQDEIFSDI